MVRLLAFLPVAVCGAGGISGTAKLAGQVRLKIDRGQHRLAVFRGQAVWGPFPAALGANRGRKQSRGERRTPKGEFSLVRIQAIRAWGHDDRGGKGGAGSLRPLVHPAEEGMGGHGYFRPPRPFQRRGGRDGGGIRLRHGDLQKLRPLVRRGTRVVALP